MSRPTESFSSFRDRHDHSLDAHHLSRFLAMPVQLDCVSPDASMILAFVCCKLLKRCRFRAATERLSLFRFLGIRTVKSTGTINDQTPNHSGIHTHISRCL